MNAPQKKEYKTPEYIPHTRKKVLKVVKKKKNPYLSFNQKARRRNALRLVGFSIMTIAMLVGTIFVLYRYAAIMELNKELSTGEKTISSLVANRDYLVTQIEPYKTTERVEKIARVNLGMEYPTKDQILYLNSGIKTDQTDSRLANKSTKNGMLSLLDRIANLR